MSNDYFAFKNFTIHQQHCAMKVTTDACVFGAWCAAEIASQNSRAKKLLDIGAGTGLLSLMIAQKTSVDIDAVEIEPQAAAQATENIHASKFPNITVHNRDVLNFECNQYDYIISNPPFYENDLGSPSITRSMAHHGSGLYWNDLFRIIAHKLSADGAFFLLLPYKRASELDELLKTHSFFIEKKITVHHSAQHAPTRLLIKGTKNRSGIIEKQLTIKKGGNYTPEFTTLLKDYYLYL